MSNSTQNKGFNDLPEKEQKEAIESAIDKAKKMQDEVLGTHRIGSGIEKLKGVRNGDGFIMDSRSEKINEIIDFLNKLVQIL